MVVSAGRIYFIIIKEAINLDWSHWLGVGMFWEMGGSKLVQIALVGTRAIVTYTGLLAMLL